MPHAHVCVRLVQEEAPVCVPERKLRESSLMGINTRRQCGCHCCCAACLFVRARLCMHSCVHTRMERLEAKQPNGDSFTRALSPSPTHHPQARCPRRLSTAGNPPINNKQDTPPSTHTHAGILPSPACKHPSTAGKPSSPTIRTHAGNLIEHQHQPQRECGVPGGRRTRDLACTCFFCAALSSRRWQGCARACHSYFPCGTPRCEGIGQVRAQHRILADQFFRNFSFSYAPGA